jgi:hypothetical protein
MLGKPPVALFPDELGVSFPQHGIRRKKHRAFAKDGTPTLVAVLHTTRETEKNIAKPKPCNSFDGA